MPNILLSGFTPFENREVNASWVAVKNVQRENIHAIQIPVVWGQPKIKLTMAIDHFQPEIIISLGEGHIGEFNIETIARNQRKHKMDNLNAFPAGPIQEDGLDQISASIPAEVLQDHILDHAEKQIPLKISEDAGSFLCEETLYTLECFQQTTPLIKTVVFVHVPPYDSKLIYMGEKKNCDEEVLADFLDRLLDGVLSIHQKQYI